MSDRLVSLDLIDPSPFARLCPPDEENIERIRADLEAGGKIVTPLHAIPGDDGRWELLAGHDRMEAARRAGLDEVPIMVRGSVVADDEKVSYVVRDNVLRKSVSPRPAVEWYLKDDPQRSNVRVALLVGCAEATVRTVRTSLEESGAIESASIRVGKDGVSQSVKKSNSNPGSDPDSNEGPPVLGPFAAWKPYRAEEAEEALDRLPKKDREPAAIWIDSLIAPPETGIEMIRKLGKMSVKKRREVLRLSQSDDQRDKSKAIEMTADVPGMPDPRILILENARFELQKATQLCDRDKSTTTIDRLTVIREELGSIQRHLSMRQSA